MYVVKNGCKLIVEDTAVRKDYGEVPEGYRSYLGVMETFVAFNKFLDTLDVAIDY